MKSRTNHKATLQTQNNTPSPSEIIKALDQANSTALSSFLGETVAQVMDVMDLVPVTRSCSVHYRHRSLLKNGTQISIVALVTFSKADIMVGHMCYVGDKHVCSFNVNYKIFKEAGTVADFPQQLWQSEA